MDIFIYYVPSAFKHGLTRANIRCAMLNWIYNDVFEDDSEKHLLIGFDDNANLLEIMYNVVDERRVKVFHAMKCRNIFLQMLGN